MSISSADSLLSVSAGTLGSFPLIVVVWSTTFEVTGSLGLLDEGVV